MKTIGALLSKVKKTPVALAICAAALTVSSAASAATIVSVDRATFAEAVVGGTIAGENFDGIGIGTTLTSLNGVSYTSSNGDVVVTDDFLTSTNPNGIGSTGSIDVDTFGRAFFLGTDTATFTFDTAITAFAIDVNTFADTEEAYSALLNTGDIVTSLFETFPNQVTGQFIGFVADTAFTSITITAETGFSFTLDTLVFGDAAGVIDVAEVFGDDGANGGGGVVVGAEVPLPAALPLMIAGLSGMGFLSRRKRQRT